MLSNGASGTFPGTFLPEVLALLDVETSSSTSSSVSDEEISFLFLEGIATLLLLDVAGVIGALFFWAIVLILPDLLMGVFLFFFNLLESKTVLGWFLVAVSYKVILIFFTKKYYLLKLAFTVSLIKIYDKKNSFFLL